MTRTLNTRLAHLEAVASPKQQCQCAYLALKSEADYQPGKVCQSCGKPSRPEPIKVYIGVDIERI